MSQKTQRLGSNQILAWLDVKGATWRSAYPTPLEMSVGYSIGLDKFIGSVSRVFKYTPTKAREVARAAHQSLKDNGTTKSLIAAAEISPPTIEKQFMRTFMLGLRKACEGRQPKRVFLPIWNAEYEEGLFKNSMDGKPLGTEFEFVEMRHLGAMAYGLGWIDEQKRTQFWRASDTVMWQWKRTREIFARGQT